MKKVLCIYLALIILCLSACGSREVSNADTAPKDTAVETETTVHYKPETTGTTPETTLPEEVLLPLPQESMEFSYLSGAGGWRTVLTLNTDGSFTGFYLDSEMGEIGDDYPNGSVYICTFSGKFGNIEKVNDFSYKLTLMEITTEKPIGTEWIEDEIRYVATGPHGLNDPFEEQECTEFILYLPDTPLEQLSEDFLSWWPYRYEQDTNAKTTLSCFGILNVTTGSGFFTVQ